MLISKITLSLKSSQQWDTFLIIVGGRKTGIIIRRKKTYSVAIFTSIFYYIRHTKKSTVLPLSVNIVRQVHNVAWWVLVVVIIVTDICDSICVIRTVKVESLYCSEDYFLGTSELWTETQRNQMLPVYYIALSISAFTSFHVTFYFFFKSQKYS